MNVCRLIEKKRDGQALSKEDIEYFVKAVTNSVIPDKSSEDVYPAEQCQIGAMLMAIYLNGMNEEETQVLTKATAESGHIFQWKPEWSNLIVGKHSTGGVGDTVSLVLIPALAACGLKIPKISGRSLGLTGGTLDKLESIPNCRVECDKEQMQKCLEEVGCCIVSQTKELVPADKVLYKSRDLTGTVDCLPLLTASIISKKICEGLSALVIDIKSGKGAILKSEEGALQLAKSIVSAASTNGIKISAFITDMNNPIGKMIGNSLEIIEAVQCLHGSGSADLITLVEEIGGELLRISGQVTTRQIGKDRIRQVISDKSALLKFRRMIELQGVDADTANKLCSPDSDPKSVLPQSPYVTPIAYEGQEGYIKAICAELLAMVWKEEAYRGEKVDLAAGLQLMVTVGDHIKPGDVWVKVHHSLPKLSAEQFAKLQRAVQVQREEMKPVIIKDILTSEGPEANLPRSS